MSYADPSVYENDEELAKMVFGAYEAAKSAMSPLRDTIWPRDYLFYHSRHDPSMFKRAVSWFEQSNGDKHPFENAIFEPLPYQQVETAVPRIVGGVLGNDIPFRCEPDLRDGELHRQSERWEWAELNGDLLNAELQRDVQIRRMLPLWVRNAEIYGTTILFVEWLVKRGARWGQRRVERRWEFQEGEAETLEDRIRVVMQPNWNVFPDPWGRCINGETDEQPCRYIDRLIILPVDELRAMVRARPDAWAITKEDDWEKKLDEVAGRVDSSDNWQATQEAKVERRGESLKADSSENKRLVRIIDHWEGGVDPCRVMVAGGEQTGVVLRKQMGKDYPARNAGLPFIRCSSEPQPHEFWARSKVERVAGITHEVNTLASIHMANLVRAVNNFVIVNRESGLSANRIVSQPTSVYDTDGTVPLDDAVKFIQVPYVAGQILPQIEHLRQQASLTGGGTDPMMGQHPGGYGVTARGTGYQIEQGSVRLNLAVHSWGESLASMGRVMHGYNQQYVSTEKLVRILGQQGAEAFRAIAPEMINQRYDIYFDTRPVAANPAMEQQMIINFANIFGQWPEANRSEIMLRAAKLMHIERPRELVAGEPDDADSENVLFMVRGQFPDVHPTDNHTYHEEQHLKMRERADAMGQGPLLELENHLNAHRSMRMGAQQGMEPGMEQGMEPGMEQGMGMPGAQMGGMGANPGAAWTR